MKLDPAEFTTKIDNPYWPMSPGSKWVYSETDTQGTHEKAVVEVTNKTKKIANGIEARVIRDTVSENGTPVEITDDWYAQDSAGNIWYLGEYVTELQERQGRRPRRLLRGRGRRSPARDRHAGESRARDVLPPGVLQGRGGGQGRGDHGRRGAGQVPFGHFDTDVLMTRDLVPTEPKVQELKFYAPGVGPLLSVHTDGAGGRAELVSYTPGK